MMDNDAIHKDNEEPIHIIHKDNEEPISYI